MASETVALGVGDSYGQVESMRIIDQVIKVHFPDLVYEESDFFRPEEYQRHRLVILTGPHSGRQYTPAETQEIEDYVQAGGRVVMIRQSPTLFPSAVTPAPHQFGKTVFQASPVEFAINAPEHALLAGVFDEVSSPSWLQGNVLLTGDDWEPLIGNDRQILVGRKEHGSGRIYYLSAELFRMKDPGDIAAWVTLIKNILSEP